MLVERTKGRSYRQIGRLHGLHHEIVRRLVLKEGSAVVADFERDLKAGRVPFVQIPYGQPVEDYTDALAMLFWVVGRLKGRGHDVRIETQPSKAGVVFVLIPGEKL
jgi:hypothetical protein